MKLYLINGTNKFKGGYDCYYGHVIATTSPSAARKLAALEAADEGKDCWLDPTLTRVVELATDTPMQEGVILSDFNAG